MIIQGQGVTLRRLARCDVDFILAITSDPEWLRFIGDRGISEGPKAKRYIDANRRAFSQQGYGLWVVESDRLQGDKRIGLCGFIARDYLAYPDLGYAFLPRGRSQGLAREAVQQVLLWGKANLTSRTVSAICRADNLRSLRLLEANGFNKIGQLYLPEQGVNHFYLRQL